MKHAKAKRWFSSIFVKYFPSEFSVMPWINSEGLFEIQITQWSTGLKIEKVLDSVPTKKQTELIIDHWLSKIKKRGGLTLGMTI